MNRRLFIRNTATAGVAVGFAPFFMGMAEGQPEFVNLTILHTNDVHSRIDPFPMDGSRNQGLGGAAKRAALIKKIRAEEKNVLLFDCGDIFQGTPYFNFFNGELEFKLMSEMGYDAATIGNHDFDAGIEMLKKQMTHANFSMLSANYDFKDTTLSDDVKPYKVFEKDGLSIGVFGLGIALDGLVPEQLFAGTKYENPLTKSDTIAARLKHEEACDYVVCLSHLGYNYREGGKVCDVVVAEHSKDIDLILGGHTHTFMKEPDIRKNSLGKPVVINQAGWAGILLGRIDISFEKNKKGQCVSCKNLQVG